MAGLVEPKKVTGGAFGRFLTEKRAELTKECSGQAATAVVKLASERFKALDEASRAEYETKYKQAVEQYGKDLEAFLAAGGEKKDIKRKAKDEEGNDQKKQKKDPDAPKKPVGGAFGCFLTKNRQGFIKECEGKPITAITKLAGERWKELSAEDRKVFDDEYAAKKAKYAEEMKSYVPPVQEVVEETPAKTSVKKSANTPTKKKEKATKTEPKADEKSGKKTTKAGARGKKTEEPPAPTLESSVATKAEKVGLTSQLLQLLKRQDMIDSGKSQNEMLKALEASDGLIHPARRALLGA